MWNGDVASLGDTLMALAPCHPAFNRMWNGNVASFDDTLMALAPCHPAFNSNQQCDNPDHRGNWLSHRCVVAGSDESDAPITAHPVTHTLD